MALWRASIRHGVLGLCVGMFWLPCLAGARVPAQGRAGALIQTRGNPLRAGVIRGASQLPLERAEGGDTPILSFRTPRGAVRLLLDTGAAATMVTPALVQRFGLALRPLAPADFALVGGGQACPTGSMASADLPALSLPPGEGRTFLRIEGVEALVLPSTPLPPGVDGVLGAPALRQLPVVVDPLAQTVALGATALRWRQTMPSPARVIPLTWRRGVPLLPLFVRSASGGALATLHGLADTGAEGVFLSEALAKRLTAVQAAQPSRLVGVCGLQEVRRQRLLGLGLHPEPPVSETVDAVIVTNPVFAELGVEAIVGQEMLRGRRQLWRLDSDPPRLEIW